MYFRAIVGVALVVGWLGCSSNGQPCGCTPDNVCLSNGVCFPVCEGDGGTCPAGLTCVQAEPYCATSPCSSAPVLACVDGYLPGRSY
jgi:hypothetical protein